MRGPTEVALIALALLLSACQGDAELRLLDPPAEVGTGGVAGAPSGGDSGAGTGGIGGTTGGEVATGGTPVMTDAELLHRYDFSGTGTTLSDLVGNADGELMNDAVLDDSGSLEFNGESDTGTYVNLPNDLISSLEQLSIVAWLEWHGPAQQNRCWQRIFDFGSNTGGEDMSVQALHSLFMTPFNCSDGKLLLMNEVSSGKYALFAPDYLPVDELSQVAAVIDGVDDHAWLYLNGELVAPTDQSLNSFPWEPRPDGDENDWLGRSQWEQDIYYLYARYDEFRIYSGLLTTEQIADLWDRGPDDP